MVIVTFEFLHILLIDNNHKKKKHLKILVYSRSKHFLVSSNTLLHSLDELYTSTTYTNNTRFNSSDVILNAKRKYCIYDI